MGDGRQPNWDRLNEGTAGLPTTVEISVDEGARGGILGRNGSGRDTKNGVVVTHEEHLPQGIHETEEELNHRWFVGSIDQGTTSSRFLIFNGEGDPVAMHQIEFGNLYPKSGYDTYPISREAATTDRPMLTRAA